MKGHARSGGVGRRVTALRLGWGVADQAVSSLENFLLGVYVARTLGTSSLGSLGLALVTYAVVLNVSRGLATDPLMVRYSGDPDDRWRIGTAHAGAVAILVGVVTGVLVILLGFGLLAGLGLHETGTGFLVLGVFLPGLTLQDSWRYAFFASGQGSKAFLNDVVWTVTLFAVLGAGQAFGMSGVGWAMVAYGASATLAGLVGMAQARVVPQLPAARHWLREQRDLGSRFMVENLLFGSGGQILSFVGAVTCGLAGIGAIRGAQMLTGPVGALLMGIAQVAVPEAARWLRQGQGAIRRLCVALGGGLAVLSLVWGGILLLVFPHGIGRTLLGDVWPGAHSLLLAVVLGSVAGSATVGPSAGLRALGRADRTVRCQLVVTALFVGLGTGASVIWKAPGLVWGCDVATVLGVVIWWRTLTLVLREHFADPHPGDGLASATGTKNPPAEAT